MTDASRPGARYWAVVEPVWRAVSIYDGPAEFLAGFRRLRPEVGHLLAATWCQSEVRNGGFHQFFMNSTGVLAPEARDGFRAIGLTDWADLVGEAMERLGDPYPREKADRQGRLVTLMDEERDREERNPFADLDDRLYAWLHAEPDRWERAADAYAASAGG